MRERKGNKMELKKKAIVEALKANMGNVSSSCEAIGISRKTFYQWKKEDEEFALLAEDLDDVILDIVESSLLEQIKGGNVTATIFYLKTKGKHRGYSEKVEIENATQVNNIINLGKGVKPEEEEERQFNTSRLTISELKALRGIQRVALGGERDYSLSFIDGVDQPSKTNLIEKVESIYNEDQKQ